MLKHSCIRINSERNGRNFKILWLLSFERRISHHVNIYIENSAGIIIVKMKDVSNLNEEALYQNYKNLS